MTKNKSHNKQSNHKGISARNFLFRPVPLYSLLLAIFSMIAISYYAIVIKKEFKRSERHSEQANYVKSKVVREYSDTSLVRPLLFIDDDDEEGILEPIRHKIIQYIQKKKDEGVIIETSVYLNLLSTAGHIEIKPQEYYDPGSLLKVATMINYLKKADDNPSILQKKIFYAHKINGGAGHDSTNKTLTEGKTYTVAELLHYMIAYSDNQAYWVLSDSTSDRQFNKLCHDITIPDIMEEHKYVTADGYYQLTVNSVSRLFRVIYNCSYLSRKLSLYAIRLLLQSEYKDGILQGVGKNIRVAHKYGVHATTDGVYQVHEFGIVYLSGNPYLLGVMTRGYDITKLQNVIGDISKIVYDDLSLIK